MLESQLRSEKLLDRICTAMESMAVAGSSAISSSQASPTDQGFQGQYYTPPVGQTAAAPPLPGLAPGAPAAPVGVRSAAGRGILVQPPGRGGPSPGVGAGPAR